MNDKMSCPVCGAGECERPVKEITNRKLFDGTNVEFEVVKYSCDICGEEFYSDDSDSNYDLAKERAIDYSIDSILKNLKDKCSSLSNFERIFGIPQRSSHRWKKKQVTAISYALLSTINQLPWIVDIVQSRFDKSVMAKVMLRETENLIADLAIENDCTISKELSAGNENMTISYNIQNFQASSDVVELEDSPISYLSPALSSSIVKG